MLNRHLTNGDTETIVALCSPRGSGSIGLIRASGVDCLTLVDSISKLSSGGLLSAQETHTINHGYVVDPSATETIVDEVLFLLMKAPKTFTGQDTVEITCHNNQFIIDKIIHLLVSQGARSARAGEFTKRAFLHGKLDLPQAEAIQELIAAQSEEAVKLSLAQLKGSLSSFFSAIERSLIELLTLTEASFEFLDEEQRDFDIDLLFKTQLAAIQTTITNLQRSHDQQKHLRDGFRIALIGGVNAGKSSLFNALVGRNRAIVTAIAGTTRDCIEYSLHKQGNFWLVIDTAGLRETDEIIEAEGIERSYEEAALADIVLLVIDHSKPMSEQELSVYSALIKNHAAKIIIVFNKSDKPCLFNFPNQWPQELPSITVSAQQMLGITELEALLGSIIQRQCATLQSPFLLNQRQYNAITEIALQLKFIEESFLNCVQYELVAYHVKSLLEKISSLTGKHISEEILDTVFSKFCIGK